MPSTLKWVNKPLYAPKGAVTRHYVEADNQSFGLNAPLIESSDKVAIAVAASTDLDTGGATILGIAKRAGQNTTDPDQDDDGIQKAGCPVSVIEVGSIGTLLELPIWHSAAPTGTDGQYSQYGIGFQCVLRNVGGVFVANVSNTTNPILELVQKFPGIPDTELFAPALWKVIA